MELDKEEVKKILTDELGYEDWHADFFLKDFPTINKELVPAVQQWLKDRTIVDTDFEGITIEEAMKASGGNFLVTIRRLNRLFDDDLSEEDIRFLKESMKKPHIRW
jgi:hypothetical protein